MYANMQQIYLRIWIEFWNTSGYPENAEEEVFRDDDTRFQEI